MAYIPAKVLERLRRAYARNELTVFAGAGVSVATGLPNWSGLLMAVFINSLNSISSTDKALFQATAQTWFGTHDLPPDIVARQLRTSFSHPDEFVRWVRFALYSGIGFKDNGLPMKEFVEYLKLNLTLSGVADLCRNSLFGEKGVRRVITYNFDNLLELRLGNFPNSPIWSQSPARPTSLPIYHVHGYLPMREPSTKYPKGGASRSEDLVLTEDQYHREASSPYNWSNMIQLLGISDSVGLAVGLSMNDPNLRRILDIGAKASGKPEIYALLPRSVYKPINVEQTILAMDLSGRIADRYRWMRSPSADVSADNLSKLAAKYWNSINKIALKRQFALMDELGVHPVWCEHDQVPAALRAIMRT